MRHESLECREESTKHQREEQRGLRWCYSKQNVHTNHQRTVELQPSTLHPPQLCYRDQ
jgi:hypothetical protein